MIVTTYYFCLIERLVFMHFLLHKVLHDARVEVTAFLFTWSVDLLRIVGKVFGTCFFKWLISTRSNSIVSRLRLVAVLIAAFEANVRARILFTNL